MVIARTHNRRPTRYCLSKGTSARGRAPGFSGQGGPRTDRDGEPGWAIHAGVPTRDVAAAQCTSFRARQGAIALLSQDLLAEVYRHACIAWPRECCGLILSSGVRRARNVQDDLHRIDPVAFPKTSEEAFCLDIRDQLILELSASSPDEVCVLYHSHPRGGTCFSGADRAAALRDRRPVYPRLLHLVVDCRLRVVRGANLYAFAGGRFRDIARFSGYRG